MGVESNPLAGARSLVWREEVDISTEFRRLLSGMFTFILQMLESLIFSVFSRYGMISWCSCYYLIFFGWLWSVSKIATMMGRVGYPLGGVKEYPPYPYTDQLVDVHSNSTVIAEAAYM